MATLNSPTSRYLGSGSRPLLRIRCRAISGPSKRNQYSGLRQLMLAQQCVTTPMQPTTTDAMVRSLLPLLPRGSQYVRRRVRQWAHQIRRVSIVCSRMRSVRNCVFRYQEKHLTRLAVLKKHLRKIPPNRVWRHPPKRALLSRTMLPELSCLHHHQGVPAPVQY